MDTSADARVFASVFSRTHTMSISEGVRLASGELSPGRSRIGRRLMY
jgi:hypothetical protein